MDPIRLFNLAVNLRRIFINGPYINQWIRHLEVSKNDTSVGYFFLNANKTIGIINLKQRFEVRFKISDHRF